MFIQLREMVVIYSKAFKDPFVLHPPAWFQAFVYCELFLQFPFFFVASYAFWKGKVFSILLAGIITAYISAFVEGVGHFEATY